MDQIEKFLSDISCIVKYDVARNQLARNIDVMPEDIESKLRMNLADSVNKHYKFLFYEL